MHLHGAGRRKKGDGSIWIGLLAAAAVVVVTVAGILQVGWAALAPFGFAAIILGVLLWLTHALQCSRACDRSRCEIILDHDSCGERR